jgi:glycosyltransferase involved in cell wall biosynthesis
LPAEIQDASLVIGALGVLRPEKGIRTLLEAFAVIAGEAAGLRLAVVGSGPGRDELGAAAERLGIGRQVHFEPSTDRPGEWFRAMDVFVLPSLSEALSNSLMEAMACGCAVVASRTGGNPELICEETTGLLFEPGNRAELASCLRRLISQPALRERLGNAAAALIHSRFTAGAAADRMGAVYWELLARRMGYDGGGSLPRS